MGIKNSCHEDAYLKRLDPQASRRVSGPTWSGLRGHFVQINKALLTVAPSARGELTTIYVKYVDKSCHDIPYAVLWLRTSNELVLGLALPKEYDAYKFEPTPKGCKYARLTAYLTIKPRDVLPVEISQWAIDAYNNVKKNMDVT